MKYYKLYDDYLETNLGKVLLEIESCNKYTTVNQKKSLTTFETLNHSIEVFAFNDIKDWLSETDNAIQQSKGWLIQITKISSNVERLRIKCELTPNDSDIVSSPDSGEWLDAVWIENKTHFLSIGTEDGEMLQFRASKNDFMPKRFDKELGYSSKQNSFTSYTKNGFMTEVPNLNKDEKIYFHYLTASNPRKKSHDYPDEDDISTNLAVGYTKKTLIERLKLIDWI